MQRQDGRQRGVGAVEIGPEKRTGGTDEEQPVIIAQVGQRDGAHVHEDHQDVADRFARHH